MSQSGTPVSMFARSSVHRDPVWIGICDELRPGARFPNKNCGFSFVVSGELVKAGNRVEFYESETGKELEFSPYTFQASEETWVEKLIRLSHLPIIDVSALREVNNKLVCRVMLVGSHRSRDGMSLIVENADGEHVVPQEKIELVQPSGTKSVWPRSSFWFASSWPGNFLSVDVTAYFDAPNRDHGVDYIALKIRSSDSASPITRVRDVGRVPAGTIVLPPEVNVRRVQAKGTIEQKFTTSAFSHYRTYRKVFERYSGRPWDEIDALLDWGCGCGRVTQHLMNSLNKEKVFGADIDKGNIDWCLSHLRSANFKLCETQPPLVFSNNTFDYITATSVFTHVPEQLVEPWLAELRRVLKPGGLAALTVGSETRLAFGSYSSDRLEEVEARGIDDSIRNKQLEGSISDSDYYRNVRMTKAYIRRVWSKYFTIVEILDHGIGVQDIVVCQKIG